MDVMKPYPLETLFGRIMSPFERFLKQTTAGGIVLIGTTVFTILFANTPWGGWIHHLFEQTAGITAGGGIFLRLTLHHWVNEGLMALFFLLVGLELKREFLVGELSSPKDAALPMVAAAGGMAVPALIYFLLNPAGPAAAGWGIPMATDIAFAVGILVLLAWRVPRNVIIFLTALAIVDDLGAVLVIALFYTQAIDWASLGSAGVMLLLLTMLNRGGVRHPLPYVLAGILLWVFLLKSGVHATIGGVLLAFTIPAKPAHTPEQFDHSLEELKDAFHAETCDPESSGNPLSSLRMATLAEALEKEAIAVQSPQQRIEHTLAPWVTFGVIPLFAFANAGVDFSAIEGWEALADPVTLGVVLGLVLGKFAGISGASWLAVRAGLAVLPRGVGWIHLCGVSWLAGIGFTMSLFISQLAFPTDPSLAEKAKLGILSASLVAAVIGFAWMYLAGGSKRKGNRHPGSTAPDTGSAARGGTAGTS